MKIPGGKRTPRARGTVAALLSAAILTSTSAQEIINPKHIEVEPPREHDYYELSCSTGFLVKHPTQVHKFTCADFYQREWGTRRCKRELPFEAEVITTPGRDYCIALGARGHSPQCSGVRVRVGTGEKTIRRGPDVCGLKGSRTRPRCEQRIGYGYYVDRLGAEDRCLPMRYPTECLGDPRYIIDWDGARDACVYSNWRYIKPLLTR